MEREGNRRVEANGKMHLGENLTQECFIQGTAQGKGKGRREEVDYIVNLFSGGGVME